MKRVGHKGADLVEPGNTRESFEAALEHGVDMIEFDILPTPEGRLVLAHDPDDAAGRTPMTMDEGLDLFATEAYAGVELDVDMKTYGYEREVAEGLTKRGLVERSIVSSTYLHSLETLGGLGTGVRRGLSVPRARRDYTRSIYAPAIWMLLLYWRRRLPGKVTEFIRDGRCEGLMAHYYLVTRRLVEQVREAGGFVYVWTVDDPKRIRELEAIGVDGVITNDPRLFEPAPA
jgi:glycerophosphoryl diester phosphodiesterase